MRWWSPLLTGGLAAGVTMFVVGVAFHLLVPLLAPSIPPQFANNPELYRPWFGWTRAYMIVHPFVYGLVFAAVFQGLGRRRLISLGIREGLAYGACVFVVGSLPIFLLLFASFEVTPEVVVCWGTQNLIQYVLAGAALGCVYGGVSVKVSRVFPAPASIVWELLLQRDTFLYITRGAMSYSDTDQWPTRMFTEGVALRTRVRLFGFGPSSPHHVAVVRVDEASREIETNEHGRLVAVWNHKMRVEPVSSLACRYTDSIELQAGLATPLVWFVATCFYRYRQRRWRRWIAISRQV